MRRTILAALLFALATVADGKSVSGQFQLDAGDFIVGPEYEITKFFFSQGKAVISGLFTYPSKDANWRTSPALFLFNDKKFQEYHDAPACEDKVEHAYAVIPIGASRVERGRNNRFLGKHSADKSAIGKITKSETSFANDEESGDQITEWRFEWTLDQKERTHGWFVIAADCALEQYGTKVAPMTYEVTLLNPGGDHLTADEHGMPVIYFTLSLLMIATGVYMVVLAKKHADDTNGKVHLAVKIFGVSFALQFLSIASESVHLWFYRGDGMGLHSLDLLSELCEAFSSLLISFVLICLACGWTLVDSEADSKKGSSVASLLRNPKSLLDRGRILGNLIAVGIIAVVVFSTVLVIANKSNEDDFTKFHDHESFPGKVLVSFRLVLGVLYLICFRATVAQQAQKGIGGGALGKFLKQIMVVGAVWFLSFPGLVFTAGFLPMRLRHRYVAVGVLVIQSACLSGLANQFLSGSSTYSKLSTIWESGLLPGAGGLMTATKGRGMKD